MLRNRSETCFCVYFRQKRLRHSGLEQLLTTPAKILGSRQNFWLVHAFLKLNWKNCRNLRNSTEACFCVNFRQKRLRRSGLEELSTNASIFKAKLENFQKPEKPVWNRFFGSIFDKKRLRHSGLEPYLRTPCKILGSRRNFRQVQAFLRQ